MAASTASSPSFLAHCATPRSISFRVYDTSALSCARSRTRFSRSCRVNADMPCFLAFLNKIFSNYSVAVALPATESPPGLARPVSRIEAQRQAGAGHVLLRLAHRMLAEMENRGGQN